MLVVWKKSKRKRRRVRNSKAKPVKVKKADGANGSLSGRRRRKVNNPFTKFVSWTIDKGALDHWTAYHIAAGLFIAKVAQWLGSSDLWAVLWVLIIGIAWEIFEYIVEGTEETYGTVSKWAWNTASDIVVEVGAAWWMVLPAGSLIG